jgi:hypothetical protein
VNFDFLGGGGVEEGKGAVMHSISLRLSVKVESFAPRDKVTFPSGPSRVRAKSVV